MQYWVIKGFLEEKEAGVLLYLCTGLLSTIGNDTICPQLRVESLHSY